MRPVYKDIFSVLIVVIYVQASPRLSHLAKRERKYHCLVYSNNTIKPTLQKYDPERKLCCNGLTDRTTQKEVCCGGTIISGIGENFCCDEKIYEKSSFPDSECCGSELYNRTDKICCAGKLNPIHSNETLECCGNVTVTSRDLCCDDVVHLGGFKPEANICCQGAPYPLDSTQNVSCCGDAAYDPVLCTCNNSRLFNLDGSVLSNRQLTCLTNITDFSNIMDSTINASFAKTAQDGIEEREAEESLTVLFIRKGIIAVSVFILVLFVLVFIVVIRRCKIWRKGSTSHTKCHTNYLSDSDSYTKRVSFQKNIFDTRENIISRYNGEENVYLTIDSIPSAVFARLDLEKSTSVSQYFQNSVASISSEAQTQTESNHWIGRRTIFGKPFDVSMIVNPNKRVVETEKSDVKLILPPNVNERHPAIVDFSSYSDLKEVGEKFGLKNETRIVSPVIEYAITGYASFTDYAYIELPFVGKAVDLNVWKFKSDEGFKTITDKEEVTFKGKQNQYMDLYYSVKDQTVRIYTKSLSGFFCTSTKHCDISLCAFIYSSYKLFVSDLAVRTEMYIVSEHFKFKDFNKILAERESISGRTLVKVVSIEIPEIRVVVTSRDDITLLFKPDESHMWYPRSHPPHNVPDHNYQQMVPLMDIMYKCDSCDKLHPSFPNHPYSISWDVVNKRSTSPSVTFGFSIDVSFYKRDERLHQQKIMADVWLREEDRHLLENTSCTNTNQLHKIKDYILGRPARVQDKFLEFLSKLLPHTPGTLHDAFREIQQRYPSTTLETEIVRILHESLMFDEIKGLVKAGCIDESLAAKYIKIDTPDDKPNKTQDTPNTPNGTIHESLAPLASQETFDELIDDSDEFDTLVHVPNSQLSWSSRISDPGDSLATLVFDEHTENKLFDQHGDSVVI